MNAKRKPGFWQVISNRERLGWIAYDWANSAFVLCVITVIGSAYFVGVFESAAKSAGDLTVGPAVALPLLGVAVTGEAAWSLVVGFSALIVALSSAFLGALADAGGKKKRFLQFYCLVGVAGTLTLWFSLPWWAVGLVILLANVGFEGGNVFYNAFLPDIADDREQDYLSSAGFAFGYLGGVLVLIASLAFFVPPRGSVHNAFLLIGLWWGGWALVTFTLLKERPARKAGRVKFGAVLRELGHTIGGIRRTPNAAWFLLAFLLYNDGIATLISNATPYAMQNIFVDSTLEKLISLNELIPVMIMIQLIAFPGAIFCGWLATRYGEKLTLYFILFVFTTVVTYGQVVQVLWEFYIMAALIGVVLGGGQAISRSVFSSLIPPGKNAEYFGFYALSSKFSAMIGPFVYGGLLLLTGDTRLALLSLTVFFLAGGLVLFFKVNLEKGREEARAGG